MPNLTDRGKDFRAAIAEFIDGRRDAKFKDGQEAVEGAAKYEYTTWLDDAARRAAQIQAVTHVLKATHPDARGSSLHIRPDSLPRHDAVGTHLLGNEFAEDVVGNAAALDVYKFLKLEVDGLRLLDWMQHRDVDLLSALHVDAAIARSWADAFSNLVRTEDTPSSHKAAKQLYWLVGSDASDDDHFHLLQPMFSSSLAHAVHLDIEDARFGENNKLARQAFHARKDHDKSYREYRGLLARKLGGTKPQNVSQLNSERRGINYLLASLPPSWDMERPQQLLELDSVMSRLSWIDSVRTPLKQLIDFLKSEPPATEPTRRTRQLLEQELGNQLALYAAEIWTRFEPGWTRNSTCQLPLHQRIWLDPGRAEDIAQNPLDPLLSDEDRDFHAAAEFGDWRDEVAGDFANWLNARLRDAGVVTVGDPEHRHWAKQAIVEAAWPTLQRHAAKAGVA